ncbi:MAG: L-threonylcarbamoyladenylate synthase [bacterium]
MKSGHIETLKLGGVGVAMTDTIYGVLGSALRPKTVERIYDIKGRSENKPFIVLISSIHDLKTFGVNLTVEQKKILAKYWPGEVSFVLPVSDEKFRFLHRDQKTLAFRLPTKSDLVEVIKIVGPLVAPSANPQGKVPAENIGEAQDYFGHKVDFYEAGKIRGGKPSTLVTFVGNKVKVLRQGSVLIDSSDIHRTKKSFWKRKN